MPDGAPPPMPLIRHPSDATTVQRCIEIVAASAGLSPAQLLARTRRRAVARPRQIVMWLARQHTRHTLSNIGRIVGIGDHKTVGHGVRRIDALRRGDPGFSAFCDRLSELVMM